MQQTITHIVIKGVPVRFDHNKTAFGQFWDATVLNTTRRFSRKTAAARWILQVVDQHANSANRNAA